MVSKKSQEFLSGPNSRTTKEIWVIILVNILFLDIIYGWKLIHIVRRIMFAPCQLPVKRKHTFTIRIPDSTFGYQLQVENSSSMLAQGAFKDLTWIWVPPTNLTFSKWLGLDIIFLLNAQLKVYICQGVATTSSRNSKLLGQRWTHDMNSNCICYPFWPSEFLWLW